MGWCHDAGPALQPGLAAAADAEEVEARAGEILGMDIKGHTVHKVLVTEADQLVGIVGALFALVLQFCRSRGADLRRAAWLSLAAFVVSGGLIVRLLSYEIPIECFGGAFSGASAAMRPVMAPS